MGFVRVEKSHLDPGLLQPASNKLNQTQLSFYGIGIELGAAVNAAWPANKPVDLTRWY